MALVSGGRSTGSRAGNPNNAGNVAGNPNNAGNVAGNPNNAGNGNAAGNPNNAGTGNAAGDPNNAGNGRKGASKKTAGKRSALKRSAKYCLVVKKKWLDLILAGSKDWEIRGCSAQRRGWFHFAESGSGGKLVGRARLVDCLNLSKESFMKNFHRHRVPSWAQVKYKSVYAWVLKEAERFERPFKYDHTQGAVIWVKVL
jgi:hypothetical protein